MPRPLWLLLLPAVIEMLENLSTVRYALATHSCETHANENYTKMLSRHMETFKKKELRFDFVFFKKKGYI